MPEIKIVSLFFFTEDDVEDMVDDVSVKQVVDAVTMLDGINRTIVAVTLSNGDTISVGGGVKTRINAMRDLAGPITTWLIHMPSVT